MSFQNRSRLLLISPKGLDTSTLLILLELGERSQEANEKNAKHKWFYPYNFYDNKSLTQKQDKINIGYCKNKQKHCFFKQDIV